MGRFPTRQISTRGNNPEVFITCSHVSTLLISILRWGGAQGSLCNDDIMCSAAQMSSFKSYTQLAASKTSTAHLTLSGRSVTLRLAFPHQPLPNLLPPHPELAGGFGYEVGAPEGPWGATSMVMAPEIPAAGLPVSGIALVVALKGKQRQAPEYVFAPKPIFAPRQMFSRSNKGDGWQHCICFAHRGHLQDICKNQPSHKEIHRETKVIVRLGCRFMKRCSGGRR